ncbi:hypothetical protein T08_8122 [Trichinella sp. T8]|nr:hypothetical protein T08_8122 [Trichinella sp. T8]
MYERQTEFFIQTSNLIDILFHVMFRNEKSFAKIKSQFISIKHIARVVKAEKCSLWLYVSVDCDCTHTVRTLRAGAHITNSTGIR